MFGFGYTAGPKAVTDATEIIRDNGYKIYYINKARNVSKKIPVPITAMVDLVRVFAKGFSFISDDELVVQWPLYSSNLSVKLLIEILRIRNIRFTLLIHDIQNLRHGVKERDLIFEKYLSQASNIIVHSPMMKEYIEQLNVISGKVSILTTFDYLTKDEFPIRHYSNNIVFAGNLSKSTFLNTISDDLLQSIIFICYGNGGEALKKGFVYKGLFHPDHVSGIEGSWGLVWDGSESFTCSGLFGNYLKYNSPHKMSLYIVAGLPLIVWSHSSLADYVEKKNLGIIIDSLYEIPSKICTVSQTRYEEMLTNIQKESIKLKSGLHLSNCLKFKSNI